MKITCNQFEGLLLFYIDDGLSEGLKQTFEEHLKDCPHCSIKFKVINSIITDIKGAYKQIMKDDKDNCIDAEVLTKKESDDISGTELSAYIDNELPEEHSVRIRRNAIAKPEIKNKIEEMYKLKKAISDSYIEQKSKLKTDYSRDIVKSLKKEITNREIYFHCAIFIAVVITALILSVWAIVSVL